MSYAEQQWTVDQVNEKIQSSDAGKDLYIAGIPRGIPIKNIYGGRAIVNPGGSFVGGTISGSGLITGVYSSVSSRSQSPSGITTVTIDDGVQTVSATSNAYYNGGNPTSSSKNTVFDSTTLNTVNINEPTINAGSTFNKPLTFKNGFSFTVSNSSSQYTADSISGSVDYILLDPPPSN